jgi:anti-sigma factor RsiW
MRLYSVGDPLHSEVAELLPWFVNGTLDEEERARVERHLADCIACSQDLIELRDLQALYADESMDLAASEGFARVQRRIEQVESNRTSHRRLQRADVRSRWTRYWWGAILIAQAAVIVLLAAALLNRPEPRYYHTLAASPVPAKKGAPLVVVFAADRTEGEIRDLLRSLHARIVDGPSAGGAYTLEVDADESQRALTELRRHSWVRFAEPGAAAVVP